MNKVSEFKCPRCEGLTDYFHQSQEFKELIYHYCGECDLEYWVRKEREE